jgi:hypothetical protein
MYSLFKICYENKDTMKTPDRMFLESLKKNWPENNAWPSEDNDALLDILNELIVIYKLQ